MDNSVGMLSIGIIIGVVVTTIIVMTASPRSSDDAQQLDQGEYSFDEIVESLTPPQLYVVNELVRREAEEIARKGSQEVLGVIGFLANSHVKEVNR